MLVQGQVGPINQGASLSPGTNAPMRQGNMGDQIISELHPKYYEATYRRGVYSAANTAAVASVAVGTTAYTGLALSNPVGSGVNLVIMKASWASSVVLSAAGFVALETGYNAATNVTHTTPVVVANNLIGLGAAGLGLADSSATLPTAPVMRMPLSNTGTLATTGFNTTGANVVDLDGSIILPPGAYIAFATFAVNTAAWFFSFQWEEVPA